MDEKGRIVRLSPPEDLRVRNHVVPASYLNFFAIPDLSDEKRTDKNREIYVYAKSSEDVAGKRVVWRASTASIPIIRFLTVYDAMTFDYVSGDESEDIVLYLEADDILERAIGSIEGWAQPIVRSLNVGEHNVRKISADDRQRVAALIASIFVRCAPFQETWERGRKVINTNAVEGADAEALLLALAAGSMEYAVAIQAKTELAIASGRWEFLTTAGNNRFITSDNPVLVYPAESDEVLRLPWEKGARIFFPLRPDLALVIQPNESGALDRVSMKEISSKQVRTYNYAVAAAATRFIFSGFMSKSISNWAATARFYT